MSASDRAGRMLRHGRETLFLRVELFGSSSPWPGFGPLRGRSHVSPSPGGLAVGQRLQHPFGHCPDRMSSALGVSLAGAIPPKRASRSASGCAPFRTASPSAPVDPWANPGRIETQALAAGLQHHRLDRSPVSPATESAPPLPDYARNVATASAPERVALEATTPHLLPAGAPRGAKKRAL